LKTKINIRDILDIRSIVVGLEVKDKDELLETMVQLAAESGNVLDTDEAKERIFAREKLMSTGVGNGVALPHAKTNQIVKTVGAFAVLSEPVEYDALDNQPVQIVLMILGKETNVGEHLKLLSGISKLLSKDSFIAEILEAETSDGILEIFENYENQS
jgi:fructose-specific phosphotransferase system IIA component